MDWQEIIALGIVLGTLTVFAYRIARRERKSGCGKGCGCDVGKKR